MSSRGQHVLGQRGGICGQRLVTSLRGLVVGDTELASRVVEPQVALKCIRLLVRTAQVGACLFVVAGGLDLRGGGHWDLHLLHGFERHLERRWRHTQGGGMAATCPASEPGLVGHELAALDCNSDFLHSPERVRQCLARVAQRHLLSW